MASLFSPLKRAKQSGIYVGLSLPGELYLLNIMRLWDFIPTFHPSVHATCAAPLALSSVQRGKTALLFLDPLGFNPSYQFAHLSKALLISISLSRLLSLGQDQPHPMSRITNIPRAESCQHSSSYLRRAVLFLQFWPIYSSFPYSDMFKIFVFAFFWGESLAALGKLLALFCCNLSENSTLSCYVLVNKLNIINLYSNFSLDLPSFA